MNIFSRVLLTIYAFCLSIISLVAVSVTIKTNLLTTIYNYLSEDLLGNNFYRVLLFLIAVVFLSVSIGFLFSGLRSNKDKKAVSKYTNIGEIKISINSIENIALTASRRLSGIRDSKAFVTRFEDGVSITIRAIVLSDINIPALSEDIQVKVKNLVEDTAGIKVVDVKVMVENIYTGYKSRVE
ncbi:MAG TPA: alkaline shock response membrane anchor protein AmaP [Clostridia bacterium]|nr:alkaline shock response membrane anchor protein AmaP [Clostridia bacterium]